MTVTNWSSIDRQIARKREYIRRILSGVFDAGRAAEATRPAERPQTDPPQPGPRSSDPFAPPPR